MAQQVPADHLAKSAHSRGWPRKVSAFSTSPSTPCMAKRPERRLFSVGSGGVGGHSPHHPHRRLSSHLPSAACYCPQHPTVSWDLAPLDLPSLTEEIWRSCLTALKSKRARDGETPRRSSIHYT